MRIMVERMMVKLNWLVNYFKSFFRSQVPDNTTLRQWARMPNSGPPDEWWDSDDDPFEPEQTT